MSASSSSKPKSKDPAWDHGFLANPNDKNKVTCNYYLKEMHGATRLKNHLAGILGDIAPCNNVSNEVRKKFYDFMNAKINRKLQNNEELNRIRAEVDLSHSEGEDSDGVGAEKNVIKLKNLGKLKQSVGPIDKFCKINSGEAREKGVKVQVQSTLTTKLKEDKRNRSCEYIAQWFYEAGVPHNTVTLPSFDRMLEAIGSCGPGLKGPTPYELSGPLLQKRKKKIQEQLMNHRETWILTGCSIMTDGWTDKKGRGIMNLMIHSAVGVCFIQSVDASADKKDGSYIFNLVDSCIEEIGEKNVIQVVTDTARPNQTMGTLLRAKWPHIYWTGCAAHCIDLMLEDIGGLPNVRNTILRAKVITVFLYAHTRVLRLMRQHLGRDLVRAGITRFATAFLNLKSLLDNKNNLRKLFRSDELNDWGYLKKDKGMRAAKIVRSDKFWQQVDDAVKMFEPLVEVLRHVDSDTPSMGFLYGDLVDAKREIALRFEENESKYKAIWEILDKRWSDKLKTPLHLAGYYLNSYFYYSDRLEIEKNTIFRANLVSCIITMGIDEETQVKILDNELDLYRNSEGSFGYAIAKKQRSNKNINPAKWWANHGSSAPCLQALAVRILNLTCSSSGCERNWSTFEQVHTKKRARLLHGRLNDLVYVKFNSKLLQKKRKLNRDPIEIKYTDILEDEANDWVNIPKQQQQKEGEEAEVDPAGEGDAAILEKKRGRDCGNATTSGTKSMKKRKKIIQIEEAEFDSATSSEEDETVMELNDSMSESDTSSTSSQSD